MTKERKNNESGGKEIDYGNILYDQKGWKGFLNNQGKPIKNNGKYVPADASNGEPSKEITKYDLIAEAKKQKTDNG